MADSVFDDEPYVKVKQLSMFIYSTIYIQTHTHTHTHTHTLSLSLPLSLCVFLIVTLDIT